jgi:template-activating factor I
MNIELESIINLLNLIPVLWLFFMYLCNIELSYDLSLQIFKYLDSIDVDDSDVKAGYSIHLVSIISYSQL